MKYTAINIGPIVKTLGMARKPKGLWAASYLFSHLMKCIYEEVEKEDVKIISPDIPESEMNKVGIYPDRIFVKGEIDEANVMANALAAFNKSIENEGDNSGILDLKYFNLMAVSTDVDKDSKALKELNRKLDLMELFNLAKDGNTEKRIYQLISRDEDSPLFKIATGKSYMSIPKLEDIANTQKKEKDDMKSHHKYFCVVQADGDNVGKIISHEDLEDGKVKEISKELVQFGLDAVKKIEDFGGLPIYAGGDDLLFIAPVVGKNGKDIFNLLDVIENESFKGVHDLVHALSLNDGKGNKLNASLSFGISINYHKHPLYEALESARNLLFQNAKKDKEKNAIAWSLRKHSGGTIEAVVSKKDTTLWNQYRKLIEATTDDDTVSAVAHKLRQENDLVDIVLASDDGNRLDALFEKFLEYDDKKKGYFDAVKTIMPTLYKKYGKDDYSKNLYCLLRTAKFIKGEVLRDE